MSDAKSAASPSDKPQGVVNGIIGKAVDPEDITAVDVEGGDEGEESDDYDVEDDEEERQVVGDEDDEEEEEEGEAQGGSKPNLTALLLGNVSGPSGPMLSSLIHTLYRPMAMTRRMKKKKRMTMMMTRRTMMSTTKRKRKLLPLPRKRGVMKTFTRRRTTFRNPRRSRPRSFEHIPDWGCCVCVGFPGMP
ncbi:hypothetical protein BDQ17DRAFT_874665 [Cyathus striatus]|nr:hypothetical protein BDQ17DRAFT_874665 [Cyathus striatus]